MRRVPTFAVVALAVALGACGDGDDTANTAIDGSEGSTSVPHQKTTTTAAPGEEDGEAIVAGADPEIDAVVTAWTTVFDSTAPVDDKLAFLEDGTALRPTLEAYGGTGEQVGGITLEPTAVEIDGDAATIAYDVNFAGSEAYGDQTGEVVRAAGIWMVARDQFCAFMASARTPCP